MLPSCIADFHVESLKLEEMYKLGACFYSLKCVSKSHNLPLPTQDSTKFLLFLLQHSHIHHTLFSADSHMGLGFTLTLANCTTNKKYKKNLELKFLY